MTPANIFAACLVALFTANPATTDSAPTVDTAPPCVEETADRPAVIEGILGVDPRLLDEVSRTA